MSKRWNLRYELFGAWCAPIFSVMTVVGFLVLARFYDPVPAHVPDAVLAARFQDHHLGIEIGMSIFCLATALLAVWSVQLSIALYRIERGSPLMTVVQAFGGLAVVLLIFISNCLWIGAAYRASSASPSVTVALDDAAWFGFLVGWVMLSLQMVAAAAITLHDRRETPLVPRWMGYASIVGAILLATANGCAVTKSGPFAWDGVLGFYLPMAIWGAWLDGHAWFVRKEVRRLQAEHEADLAGGLAASPPARKTVLSVR